MRNAIRGCLALAAMFAAAPAAEAQLAFALRTGGTELVSFELQGAPGSTANVIGNLSGAVTSLSAIDFRPADGLLYGYDAGTNQLVTVNTATGVTTLVGTFGTAATGPVIGMDFNPVADRLRVVNSADQNLRVNPASPGGAGTIVDGTLAYGAGDPNFGVNPNIQAAAYALNDNSPLTPTTQLYYLDATTNTLVTTSNPNGGVLTTVGALGITLGSNLRGFDIVTNGAIDEAYLLLNSGGFTSVYTVNLATGAAQLDNFLFTTGFSGGFAISAVPEPGSLALLAVAGVGFAAWRRRRVAVA